MEILRIAVDGDVLNATYFCSDHVVDRVVAGTSDTNYTNACE